MNDEFILIPWRKLFEMTMRGVEEKSVFDIPDNLFYHPARENPLRTHMFGQPLENPIGISAGPHSQLAQNIVAAWLCGARYIELKTVQTDDELDIPRPCIDMPYEGYNCEFSQELKIRQSFDQYLNAWILIHILKDKLGWKDDIGTIFNMSIGYDLKGIRQENVTWFLHKMRDCRAEKEEKLNAIADLYPAAKSLNIPDCISDNVTLSTMHGCPPGEIQQIGEYLLQEHKLHTYIKFNPTLLGANKIREILTHYNYPAIVPDEAFEHDISYNEAVHVIQSLQKTAQNQNLHFGLKLTNTLETRNHKDVFEEESMFMSGKALHPISINVARKLKNEDALMAIPVSFSGGVDASNIAETLACGFRPLTVSSDLLRPGGYGKLSQYIELLQEELQNADAGDPDAYVSKKANENDAEKAAIQNLNHYADSVLNHSSYYAEKPSIHLDRPLNAFDCIQAPCESTCPSGQQVAGYLYHTARGEYNKAFEVVMHDNPFPSVSGMICDHECQTRCTRVLYDDPLLIREIKRFVAENGRNGASKIPHSRPFKTAIIGGGPSGLSCAYFLAKAGVKTEIFEAAKEPGGMVSKTIPAFRLSEDALHQDIQRIEYMGVQFHFGEKIDTEKYRKLKQEFDYLYIAVGAPQSKTLNTKGAEEVQKGIYNPLELLADIKAGKNAHTGKNIIVLGGGNVAMDVARTLKRLAGKEGNVTLAYRRTQQEMPAEAEELAEAREEGIDWIELANPAKVISKNGILKAVHFQKMKIEGTDQNGRPKPVPDGDNVFMMNCDMLVPAFGQEVEPEFRRLLDEENDTAKGSQKVFVGGDAKRGASTLIKAIADGKQIARTILQQEGIDEKPVFRNQSEKQVTLPDLQYRKARVKKGIPLRKQPPDERRDFGLVIPVMQEAEARLEAERCMYCDELCNICVDVCPNRANHGYQVKPFAMEIPAAKSKNGKIQTYSSGTFRLEQTNQVLNIKDFCNECGNCETFCPSNGAPFRDKPQVHLSDEGFAAAEEGFRYKNGKLLMKTEEGIKTLQKNKTSFVFESEKAEAQFDAHHFQPEQVTLKEDGQTGFSDAVMMWILHDEVKKLSETKIVEQ